jgi:hypothetical protein
MRSRTLSRVFVVVTLIALSGLCQDRASAGEDDGSGEGIPAALKGFRGMMSGRLVEKGESSIVFKAAKIMKVWKGNKAENPEKAVGETMALSLEKVSAHHGERIMKNFRALKAGDRIEVEAFDLGGDRLFIKEWLKKAGVEEPE